MPWYAMVVKVAEETPRATFKGQAAMAMELPMAGWDSPGADEAGMAGHQ